MSILQQIGRQIGKIVKWGVWVQFYYLILIKATIYYEKVAIIGYYMTVLLQNIKKKKMG